MFQDGLNEVNPFSFFYHSIIEGSVIKFTWFRLFLDNSMVNSNYNWHVNRI